MKIVHRNPHSDLFENVKIADCFLYMGDVFMKTFVEGDTNAIRLRDAETFEFDGEDSVDKLDVELIVLNR